MIFGDGGNATQLLPLGSKAEQDRLVIAKPTNEEEVAMFRAEVDRWTCEIASARTSVGKATDNGLEPNHDRLVSDMLAPGYDRGYCQVADRRALEHAVPKDSYFMRQGAPTWQCPSRLPTPRRPECVARAFALRRCGSGNA